MSDETPGAGQGALPPREGVPSRTAAERPAVRITQVAGGQYVLTSQPHVVPALAQISGSETVTNATVTQGGITRIISISPSRNQMQTSPLRPSLTNQSIVDALIKSRTNANVHVQLFPSNESSSNTTTSGRSLKRSLPSTPEKRDSHAAKLQRVMNHRNVRSKIVKEKYNEHLLESFYLEVGGNILDLYQFSKRPKTQQYLQYLKENAIDPKDYAEEHTPVIPVTTTMPTATSVSSLPGASSHTSMVQHNSSTPITSAPLTPQNSSDVSTTPKIAINKMKVPVGGSNQEQIVEKAKQEAYVVQRISELQKEGLWSEKRLPKVQEMQRTKAHWDFLLEEMVWLAADFAQERKWKKAAAKKCARMVQKYFQDKALAVQKAEKAQEQHLKRIAAFCAKEIKNFWSNVEKLVEYKQHTRLEEKRKKALDQHLSFIVDQTEKYSQLLAEGMNKTVLDVNTAPVSKESSRSASRATNTDDDFQPESHSSDDEETIAHEEAVAKEESTNHRDEIAALQRENEMDFETFLSELPKDYLQNRDKIQLSDSSQSNEVAEDEAAKNEDDDFVADSSSEEDIVDTIEEQEKVENEQTYKDELDDLEAENLLSVEELRKKYSGLSSVTADNEDTNMSSETNITVDESKDDSSVHSDSDAESSLSEENLNQEDVGLKSLIDDFNNEGEDTKTDKNNDLINDAAAIAESIQPKGNTLSSTSVVTPVPFLLKLPLREYQHIGLDWLVTMYERKLNGILADEMGLGKTIQTIALLAHLACEKGNWGPHLIIVPTSVMLNWEMECKKWCPAFKILTYYGTQKERKIKRTGWTKPNAFHICITSYKLVIQDHQSFRRKKWKYLILDEAQNIKNFKSQRWQLLLNFQTQQRLLLTGTPLQNNLMELWSLMHFLMPNVFQSHREFKEWFSNPVTGMIEGNSEYNDSIIKRLHKVLRPFLLRRLKSEVEKQMPKKFEHIIMCRLSKRQRFLYDDYMSRAKTRETLASGNLLSVINVLMQLRKVCNHPNLFEVRPTISPFHCEGISYFIPSLVYSAIHNDPVQHIDLYSLNLNLIRLEYNLGAYESYRMRQYQTPEKVFLNRDILNEELPPKCPQIKVKMTAHNVKKPEVKEEPKEVLVFQNSQSNIKLKITAPPAYGGNSQTVKTVPIVNVAPGTPGQIVNVTSVLKPDNKISASFAQLVQTSTGKHILLTTTPSSANIPATSGHKITLLSKPVSTAGNVCQQIAKAYAKLQLTTVPAPAPTSNCTPVANEKTEDEPEVNNEDEIKTVGIKYIDRLYSKQPRANLDVRWNDESKDDSFDDEEGDSSEEVDLDTRLKLMAEINARRCSAVPMYGNDFHEVVKIYEPNKIDVWSGGRNHCLNTLYEIPCETTDCLRDLLYTPERRIESLKDIFDRFIVYVPSVRAPEPDVRVLHPNPSIYWEVKHRREWISQEFSPYSTLLHPIASSMITQFPEPRLIQYDCGKLQTLDRLLRKLKCEGHRVLIFTQMTKMLDVLEAFLNFHGHIYLRLDGSTKIDQRQVLMERFNGDVRIFAFILSTRSGGIGVNLTGADTVIFYDSDWNPTMDAQAQDRCHRIGQTRDVHIYRLISERTIEENILKKANQKRLLGDLAIEGGNFTTAYFKSSTIQDLFNIDSTEESAANRMSEVIESAKNKEDEIVEQPSPANSGEDKTAIGALENALAACEDDQDVQAARTAKAEAVADLAEFDENIPLDEQEKEKEPEVSKAEQEVENLIKQLTPVERYAMRFIEETEAAWSAEQLAAAEREIEEQKREWEENRLAAMREEEERRARELEEENDVLTYSREDATNQVWLSENTMEQMPMWCPPTPPQQDTDVYVDHTMAFLYDTKVMPESQLPPVYIKKEVKRLRHEPGFIDNRKGIRSGKKDEMYVPKSLFERPSPALVKMRRDMKLQKFRGIIRPPVPIPGIKMGVSKPTVDPPCWHNWTINEDMALLKVIQTYQGLPLNLIILSPGHTPNWDFVADYVNAVSVTYRSPKQCRHRYETVLLPREEGKQTFDNSQRKKKNRNGGPLHKFPTQQKANRLMRTLQLYMQDNNCSFSKIWNQRYDALKQVSNKRVTMTKTVLNNPLLRNPKHAAVLTECGIDLDHPVLPVEVAARRAERIARENKPSTQRLQLIKNTPAQQTTPNIQTTIVQATTTPAAVVTTTAALVSQAAVVTHTSAVVVSTVSTTVTTPNTPPNTLRQQRIITSPLQTSAVVSVSGLTPAQLQSSTQRLILTGSAQAKAIVSSTGKAISPAQLQILKQAASLKQQQLRLQAGNLTAQAVKTTTVTIAGQTAVQVQFTQAQPRTQFVRQGAVTVTGKQGLTRTVTESEMQQILKKQQQQKVIATAVGTGAQVTTIQSLSSQVFAQAIHQAGTSGTQVATLVKAIPSSGGATQTVTIPVTGIPVGTPIKALAPTLKTATTPQQMRQIHLQQQLLAQKKLVNQKITGIAQVSGKGGVAAQLIVGPKPLSTAMTMQQLQQVIRTPLGVSQGSVVLTKSGQRVIPVNTAHGAKQTIQVVTATSQGITTAIRPQASSALAGALTGIKVQGATNTQAQQALLSQVSAALQNQGVGVRQSSPVRIQTASGTPLVAVSVHSAQNLHSGNSPQTSNTDRSDQVNRFLKKQQ